MKLEFSPYIAFQVKDYEKAVDFYEQVMGMQLLHADQHEAELRCGPITFYAESGEGHAVFFEFKTNDLVDAKETLEQAGCRLEVARTPEGDLSYFVYDPYGMVFHLWQGE